MKRYVEDNEQKEIIYPFVHALIWNNIPLNCHGIFILTTYACNWKHYQDNWEMVTNNGNNFLLW